MRVRGRRQAIERGSCLCMLICIITIIQVVVVGGIVVKLSALAHGLQWVQTPQGLNTALTQVNSPFGIAHASTLHA